MENGNKRTVSELFDILEISKSGYLGILPNGNLVDRRKHPTAIPVAKNEMFNCPEPKQLDK